MFIAIDLLHSVVQSFPEIYRYKIADTPSHPQLAALNTRPTYSIAMVPNRPKKPKESGASSRDLLRPMFILIDFLHFVVLHLPEFGSRSLTTYINALKRKVEVLEDAESKRAYDFEFDCEVITYYTRISAKQVFADSSRTVSPSSRINSRTNL